MPAHYLIEQFLRLSHGSVVSGGAESPTRWLSLGPRTGGLPGIPMTTLRPVELK